MTAERPRRRRPPIEIELWTAAPTRRYEEVAPVAARLRATGDLSPEIERRLDRRLARAAHGAGADAVLQVIRRGPVGAGSARAFEAGGLGVRWTESPPSPARPGTAEAAVSAWDASASGMALAASVASASVAPGMRPHPRHDVVREAPRLETIVRESSVGRAAKERLATIATASPMRQRAARAMTGALAARAKQLAVSPEAREKLERWAHEAHDEVSRRPPTQTNEAIKLPSGCVFIVLGIMALIVFNVFGTCVRMMTSAPQ